MPWAAASAWAVANDYDGIRGCNHSREGGNWDQNNWTKHGQGDFPTSSYKGKGRVTWAKCTKGTGNNVAYRPGQRGHPCAGSPEIKGIPINIWFQDKTGYGGRFNSSSGGAQAAFWCRFPDTSQAMVDASGRTENNNGKLADGSTVYEQLLFGVNATPSYKSTGFCENVNNLPQKVHKDGRTCYDMIKTKSGEVLSTLKGVEYCKANRTDLKCKCINVSEQGFMTTCKNNPNWAGCTAINNALKELEKAGVSSATGLFGNADCLVPQICSGSDLYMPQVAPQACNNKLAICNQIMQLDNIQAAAGVQAAQACNINFAEEQRKKDDAKAAAAKAAADKAAADKAAADKAAADKAAADRAAAAAAAAPRPSPAPTPRPASTSSPTPSSKLAPTPSSNGAPSPSEPATVPGVAGTVSNGPDIKLIGGAAFVIFCLCCMVLLFFAMSGSGRGRGRR